MTVFDRLLAPVLLIRSRIEATRPKHGNEPLIWLDLVRVLGYFCTRRCASRNAWAVALANADLALHVPPVPRMTHSDGLRRFPPNAVALGRGCITRLPQSAHTSRASIPAPPVRGRWQRIPTDQWNEAAKSEQTNAKVKLHLSNRLRLLVPERCKFLPVLCLLLSV
jgi:hypothetical protein